MSAVKELSFSRGDKVTIDTFGGGTEAVLVDPEPCKTVHPFTLDVDIHYGKVRVALVDTGMVLITDESDVHPMERRGEEP